MKKEKEQKPKLFILEFQTQILEASYQILLEDFVLLWTTSDCLVLQRKNGILQYETSLPIKQ